MKAGARSLLIIYTSAATVIATPYVPDTGGWRLAWAACVAVIVGSGIGFLLRDFAAEGKKLAAKRKEELRVQRIRELEKDLGYPPLELGDPTAEPVREPLRKETETP